MMKEIVEKERIKKNQIMKKEAFLISIVLMTVLVMAAPSFHISGTSSYLEEEDSPVFSYNFSANVTNPEGDILNYTIEEIKSTLHEETAGSFYYWVVLDPDTGVMTINSTQDNETGELNISVTVLNTIPEGMTSVFYFRVNATNDAPNFTNIEGEYNLTQDMSFLNYVNATDEEEHYPLDFDISFLDNCTLASWSTRENCTLFNITEMDNLSAVMSYSPSSNDAGIYYANITITDYGENFTCSSGLCTENYQENKTYTYNQIIAFNVDSALSINVSDCQGLIFHENQSNTCQINITTKNENNLINITSIASLRHYDGEVSNTSWFYAFNQTNTVNFIKTVDINVTADKTEVGNWTINFTVDDEITGENSTEQIYIYVNRTYNALPEFADISNQNISIDQALRINITVYDDDLLIPDKNETSGGYNETSNFTLTILNQSDLSQQVNISGFDIEILNMPISGTNITEAKIEFTPNSSEAGDYMVNLTVIDQDEAVNETTFNLTIFSNNAPVWSEDTQVIFADFEDNETYFNLSENVSDADGEALTFSFTNDTSFPAFSLNSTTGEVNFTPADADVGQHLVYIDVSDGFLTASKTFNFTVDNINETPVIETPISATNATVDEEANITTTEDNVTTIDLWIQDDDFKIPSEQRGYYNESLSVNLTIEGENTELFSFTKDGAVPTGDGTNINRSHFTTTFTPGKSDVGEYNITINISDESNISVALYANLTIISKDHNPVLMSLENQTAKVNGTLYYLINASDIEDGNSTDDGNTNLTFSYTFLAGGDIFNTTVFNTATGEINLSLNDTQAGQYNVNITVNDSGGLEDSEDFWIFVYDSPEVLYPDSSIGFSLIENVTENLNFTVNHSIQDNLTFSFYLENSTAGDVLEYNLSYYGNETNLTWEFTPDFEDETYNETRNLTLIVFNSLYPELNATVIWNVTINHSNAPINFSAYMGDKQSGYNLNIQINLTQYFEDFDYSDSVYNQSINFSVASNSTPSYISWSVSDWLLTLSSLVATDELAYVSGTDLDEDNVSLTSADSNTFEVEFTTPEAATETATVTVSGGGGTTKKPVSLKIILPDPVSAFKKDSIVVPITLRNSGSMTLNDITLSSIVAKDGATRRDIDVSFDKSSFDSLGIGGEAKTTLTIFTDTNDVGLFEITINADVKSPAYKDWGKLYLTVKETNMTDVVEQLVFTEEFIAENPECIEINEMVNEAKKLIEKGKNDEALEKAKEAVDACKYAISQPAVPRTKEKLKDQLYRYLSFSSVAVFALGISYYVYKRIKFRRLRLKS